MLVLLGGCALANPSIDVDHSSVDMPRGTSRDILVTADGEPVPWNELVWSVEDAGVVTITKSYDGNHMRIGGDHEGDTVVHVSSYGQDRAIVAHVGPPALVTVWTEPEAVDVLVGTQISVRAMGLDTLARIVDVTDVGHWDVRDESIVQIDPNGMMVRALETGETTINVAVEGTSAVVPVAVFK